MIITYVTYDGDFNIIKDIIKIEIYNDKCCNERYKKAALKNE